MVADAVVQVEEVQTGGVGAARHGVTSTRAIARAADACFVDDTLHPRLAQLSQ